MNHLPKFTFLFFITLIRSNIFGQAFTYDHSFQLEFQFQTHSNIRGIIEDDNHKIIVFGDMFWDQFWLYPNNFNNLGRYHPDGTFDYSYLSTAWDVYYVNKTQTGYFYHDWMYNIVDVDFDGNYIYSGPSNCNHQIIGGYPFLEAYVYPDGKKLLGCMRNPAMPCPYPAFAPETYHYLRRLLPDCTLDTTFHHDTDDMILGVKGFNHEAIFLWGHFEHYDSFQSKYLVKIDSTGAPDTSFRSRLQSLYAKPFHLQDDGRLIIAGRFTIEGIDSVICIARLMPDGSLDHTFNNRAIILPYGNPPEEIYSAINVVYPTTDGGYLIGGHFTQYDGHQHRCIVKTDSNGFADTQYFIGTGFDSASSPLIYYPIVYDIIRSHDDYYYVAGNFKSYNGQQTQPIIRFRGLSAGVQSHNNPHTNVTLFPNPSDGNFQMQFFDLISEEIEIRIFDIKGKLILQQHMTVLPDGLIPISLTELKSGYYFIQAFNDSILTVKSFSIIK